MKIETLTYNNWRVLADFTLEVPSAAPVIISGPNGSGKTSALQGLEFLITGNNPTGRTKDAGLLREGAKAGFVAGALNGETVRRNIGGSLEVEGLGKKAGVYEREQKLMALAGLRNTTDAERALRTDLFLDLASKEQAEAFYHLLAIRVPKELVQERLEKLERDTKLPILKTFKDVYGPVSGNVDAIHNKLAGSGGGVRRERKRILKEACAVLDRLAAEKENGQTPIFVEEPDREEINALKARQLELATKVGEASATAKAHEKLKAEAESLRKRLAGAWTERRMTDSEAEIEKLKALIAELDSPGIRLREVKQKIEAAQDTCCVTCGRPWPDASDRAAAVMTLTQEEQQLARQADEERKHSDRLAMGERLVREQRALDGVRQRLAQVEAELAAYQAPEASEVEGELICVRQRLADLETDWHAAAEYRSWNERRVEAETRVRELTDEVGALEELVKLTGPTGLKAEVLKQAREPVADQLTGTLSNWDMAAQINDDLQLEIQRDGKWRPARDCSDGERILVAVALQVWLAEVSGTRIILMDRLEALDSHNLPALVGAVTTLLEAGAIDHAFLAGVDLEAAGVKPTIIISANELLEV